MLGSLRRLSDRHSRPSRVASQASFLRYRGMRIGEGTYFGANGRSVRIEGARSVVVTTHSCQRMRTHLGRASKSGQMKSRRPPSSIDGGGKALCTRNMPNRAQTLRQDSNMSGRSASAHPLCSRRWRGVEAGTGRTDGNAARPKLLAIRMMRRSQLCTAGGYHRAELKFHRVAAHAREVRQQSTPPKSENTENTGLAREPWVCGAAFWRRWRGTRGAQPWRRAVRLTTRRVLRRREWQQVRRAAQYDGREHEAHYNIEMLRSPKCVCVCVRVRLMLGLAAKASCPTSPAPWRGRALGTGFRRCGLRIDTPQVAMRRI